MYSQSNKLGLVRMAMHVIWPVLLGMAFLSPVHAIELSEGVQIHGFASQGYISTTANNYFGDSEDGGSFDFRELGLNGSWQVNPDLSFSAQLLGRWAGETDEGDLRLDFGLVDYSFLSDESRRWGVRAGRIKLPFGLYNTTRDVAHTRPSIFLPQAVYFEPLRNVLMAFDGAQIYGEQHTGIGDFYLELYGGYPQVDNKELERYALGTDWPGHGDAEDPTLGGRLLYERDNGTFRLGLSVLNPRLNYARGGPFDPLSAGTFDVWMGILSAQYNAERWSLTGEYLRFNSVGEGFDDYFPFIQDVDVDSEGYYLQGTYRFSPVLEGVVRYDAFFLNRDDREGRKVVGAPSHSMYGKDWTVGLRWDVTPEFMVRGEFHHVDGTAWLPRSDNLDAFSTERHWNMFSLLFSYRF